MTSFETTNSVFNITGENNSFPIIIPGYWQSKSAEKTIDEPNNLLEFRSQHGIDLHVEQVRNKRLILIKDHSLSRLGTFENEILEKLKKAKYIDLEDLVYKFQLTYDEIIDILDLKYIPLKRTEYSLNQGIYEVVDLNNTSNYFVPNNLEVNNTIDDLRLKSKLKINQTLFFSEKSSFTQY